jgi:protein-S-isoprenylcysteine O-methyltransferase Ste14
MTALWHYHAALMSIGFFLLCTGMLIARYMKSRHSWLQVHKLMGLSGALVILSGLVMAIYMVSSSTGAHFSVPHAYLGSIILIFAVMTPLLGYAQFKSVGEVVKIRSIHRWSGRITLVLLLINILSGISLVGAL